jgi:uncharacterized protein
VKININQIPPEGLALEGEIVAAKLELTADTDIVRFKEPIRIKAQILRITNAVTVNLILAGSMYAICSRCLKEFTLGLKKNLQLNYTVNKLESTIDLDPQIREEIVLDYPIKPLCSPECKGLCPRCGQNFNEGGCCCAAT